MKWENLNANKTSIYRPVNKVVDKKTDLPFVAANDHKNPVGVTTPAQRKALKMAEYESWVFYKQDESATSPRLRDRLLFTNPKYENEYLSILKDGSTMIVNKSDLNPASRSAYYFDYDTEDRFLKENKLFIENIQAMKKLSELLLTEAEIAEKAVSKKLNEWTVRDEPERFGQQIIDKAIRLGFLTHQELNADVIDAATEVATQHGEDEEIGSSDMTYIVMAFLNNIGKKTSFVNGRLTLADQSNPQPTNEISTGLARKAGYAAGDNVYQANDNGDSFAAEKGKQQGNTFTSYINPSLLEYLSNFNIKAVGISGGIRLTVRKIHGLTPSDTDLFITITPNKYSIGNGVASDIDPSLIGKMPTIIKRVQQDLAKTPTGMYETESAVGNPAALYDMDKEGGQKSSAYVSKNMPTNGIPVMENKEKEADGSNVKKKIKYKMTEDQKKMFDELRMIQEGIRKIDGNKKLLY